MSNEVKAAATEMLDQYLTGNITISRMTKRKTK